MKQLFCVFIFSIIFSENLMAAPAKVEKIFGEVLLNKRKLKIHDEIVENGALSTKEKSFVKISVPNWGASISLGPNSSMDFSLESKSIEKVNLRDGIARWISTEKHNEKGIQVRTKTAAFGVRGTDFLATYAASGESEIIVFDGKVAFHSASAKHGEVGNGKIVNKGQWGGVGGKHGKVVGELIDLPSSKLQELSKQME